MAKVRVTMQELEDLADKVTDHPEDKTFLEDKEKVFRKYMSLSTTAGSWMGRGTTVLELSQEFIKAHGLKVMRPQTPRKVVA